MLPEKVESALLDRRSEVISLLRSINVQIKGMQREPLSSEKAVFGLKADHQQKYIGIKERGRLSWRGKELAKKVFESFDCDADEEWNEQEYKNYLEALGVSTREKKSPIRTLKELEAEVTDTIENHVLALHLRPEPKILEEWQFVSGLFDTFDRDTAFRSQGVSEGDSLIRKRLKLCEIIPAGKIDREDFQLLSAACGKIMTADEARLAARILSERALLAAAVRARKRQRNTLESGQSSKVDANDSHFIYKDSFLAWWFSEQHCKDDDTSIIPKYARHFLGSTLGLKHFLRSAQRNLDTYFREAIIKLRDDGILSKQRISKASMGDTSGRFDFKFFTSGLTRASTQSSYRNQRRRSSGCSSTCSVDDEDQGMQIEASLGYITSLDAYTTEKHLPEASGSSILIDLGLQPDAELAQLVELKVLIATMMRRHIDPDLKRLCKYYMGTRVLLINASKEKKKQDQKLPNILRIQLLWRADGTIDDYVLNMLGLPFLHILGEISFSLRSSHSLRSVLTHPGCCPGYDIKVFGNLKQRGYARTVIALVIRELTTRIHDLEKRSALDQQIKSKTYQRAKSRTLASHGVLLQRAKKDLPEVGILGYEAPVHKTTNTISQADRSDLKSLLDLLQRVAFYVGTTKSIQLQSSTNTLDELFFDNSLARAFLPVSFRSAIRAAMRTPGGVARAWSQFTTTLEEEAAQLSTEVERLMSLYKVRSEAKAQKEAAARANLSEAELRRRELDRQVKLLESKLNCKHTRTKNDIEASSLIDDDDSYISISHHLEHERALAIRDALDLYSLSSKCLTGPQSIACQSGKVLFNVELSGCDFFDILLPST